MRYNCRLEGKLSGLERELRIAQMNNWDFEIANLKDEIKELEMEIEREFKMAYEG